MERAEVFEVISKERDFQEKFKGEDESHIVENFPLGSALSAIQVKLDLARVCWYNNQSPHQLAMEEIRKIAAICVQMGEQNGMPSR